MVLKRHRAKPLTVISPGNPLCCHNDESVMQRKRIVSFVSTMVMLINNDDDDDDDDDDDRLFQRDRYKNNHMLVGRVFTNYKLAN